jgi:hypothetical protein
MRVLKALPPNYRELVKLFPIRGKAVIFAWGDTVYNPSGVRIAPEIIAHENVHLMQQSGIDPSEWWRRYVDDSKFRIGVEIPAHRAEADFLRGHGQKWGHVAKRLAGPLYGSGLTEAEAILLIGR